MKQGNKRKTKKQKGDALESAVHAIESVILRKNGPNLNCAFVLEPKKIITVDGVRYEIDLYIEVAPVAHGYPPSIYLFESKNWKRTVGWNQVSDLARKVDVTGAARGFVVAKSFSKDARNFARQNPRIELLSVSEIDGSSIVRFPFVGGILTDPPKCRIELRPNDAVLDASLADDTEVTLGDKTMPLREYIEEWMRGAVARRTSNFGSHHAPEGETELGLSEERDFIAPQMFVCGRRIAAATLIGTVKVRNYKSKYKWSFEVEDRGRVVVQEINMTTEKGETLCVTFQQVEVVCPPTTVSTSPR